MMIATTMGTQTDSMSHPPLPDWFSLYAGRLSLSHLLSLTLNNCRSMKILFAVSESPFNTFDVALKTNGTPSGEFRLHKSR
jgi:hypothetical protein